MCGKGVDQTTRTPQCWQIQAPELQERLCLGHEVMKDTDLAERLFSANIDFDIWGLLARPVLPVTKPNKVKKANDHPPRMSFGIFDTLSNELVDMVISYVSTCDSDLIAFGLSCQSSWERIVHCMQTRYIKNAAPWAGKKIALQGSWSTTLPEPFKENELAEKIVENAEFWVNRYLSRCLYCFMEDEGTAPRTIKTQEESLLKVMDQHFAQSKIPRWTWAELKEQLRCPDLFPLDRDWILRNLTTQEYLTDSFKTSLVPVTEVRLVEALLMRILWTNLSSWFDTQDGYQGRWAGHCFDIVTTEEHVKEEGSREWKNVTDDWMRRQNELEGNESDAE
jgi:hypothetical protein